VIVGIGDDAAVLAAADGRVVATTDMLIEGRHFRREWSPAGDIGRKAAARNLADIAAMGATPIALLVSFAGPGDLEVGWVLELADGIATEAAAAGAGVAGGDTSSADVVTLAVTALGDLAGREPVTRRGARPGDVVALAGTVGAAAAGLALLTAGMPAPGPDLAALVAAHRRPEPPYDAGPEAAKLGATSMIDISDGLIADLGHVADSSGVLIELTSSLVAAEPVANSGPLASAAALVGGADWKQWVLTGGDDHALAATFPASVTLPGRWTVVGRVTPGQGVLVDGKRWDKPSGWEHFRAQLRIVANAILNVTRRSGHLLDITTLMPRHRAERLHRSRAERHGIWPGRSLWPVAVKMRLAGGAEEGAARRRRPASDALHARRATSFAGFGRVWRRQAWRSAGTRSGAEYRRIIRGAMLTPWFAVSVGLVAATSLTLAAPHPALSFPAPRTGSCVLANCGVFSSPQPSGRHPAAAHEDPLTSRATARSTVRVEYAEQSEHKGQFMAVIVIIGRHPLKHWTLEFSLPGAQIKSIWWAPWRRDGANGVIVSGSPLPWPRSGANEARIVIAGVGTPSGPTGCLFDHASCTFRALTGETPKHGHWPFGR
jgi:thiamine-monophosphate kinase